MTVVSSSAALRITHPGVLSTVQDFGRFGFRKIGVPVSGALNPIALHLANALVGNAPEEAGIEMMGLSCGIEVLATSACFAMTGSDASIRCQRKNGDEVVLSANRTHHLAAGDKLLPVTISDNRSAVIAFAGGFRLDAVLNSKSTYTRAALGGFQGRQLREGDVLDLNRQEAPAGAQVALASPLDLYRRRAIRVVPGPHEDAFTCDACNTLLMQGWEISQNSDRMGFRLQGPPLKRIDKQEYPSAGIVSGSIQVANDGHPIVLLADAQTTGGYPRIATVISADLALLGAMLPGETLRFESVSITEAEAACRSLANELEVLSAQISPIVDDEIIDADTLLNTNLISGATTGDDLLDE